MQNWMRRLMADGVVFYPPEGRRASYVRIRERIRPLRRLRDIRGGQLAALAEAQNVQPGEVRRLVTLEGEHAVIYSISAEAPPDRLQLVTGLIFGDDHYTSVDSMCLAPEMAGQVAHTVDYLVSNLPLGLGTQRRRRYGYHAPEGWQPIAKNHSVSWYPPEFPQHRAVIRVFDAVPARDTPQVVLSRRMFDDPQTDLSAVTDSAMMDMLTDTGLPGVIEVTRGAWSDGSPSAMIRVTLQHAGYAYNLRLETSEPYIAAAQKTFQTLIRSVEAVPAAPVEPDEGKSRLIHWAE